MPCVISDDEIRAIRAQENEKIFGKRASYERITEEVACELARLMYAYGTVQYTSPLAQKWIEHHKAKDEAAGRAWLK